MKNQLQDDATFQPTPEVAPLVGSLSTHKLALLACAIAVLLFVVISFSQRKSKSKGNALLLVGPPDSGKTAILSSLAYNRTLPSHTSLQPSSVHIVLSSTTSMRLIDIPGHPRIRDQFREHLSDAKAIAFVVDSSTISRSGAVVAEHLHHVMHAIATLPPTQSTPALLILAHKADLLKVSASTSSAVSEVAISRVRTILERELEKRKASQSGGVGVESLGAEREGSQMGGLECRSGAPGVSFKFGEWAGGAVDFASTWVKVGEVKDEEKSEDEGGLNSLKVGEVKDEEKSEDEGGLNSLKDWLERLPK